MKLATKCIYQMINTQDIAHQIVSIQHNKQIKIIRA
jgi:hypothetical protein